MTVHLSFQGTDENWANTSTKVVQNGMASEVMNDITDNSQSPIELLFAQMFAHFHVLSFAQRTTRMDDGVFEWCFLAHTCAYRNPAYVRFI